MTERLTDERLAELRKIAEAAQDLSPVAWGMDDGIDWEYRVMAGDQYLADTGDPVITAHIAAFQPSTVLALLDELTEARKQLRGQRPAFDASCGCTCGHRGEWDPETSCICACHED